MSQAKPPRPPVAGRPSTAHIWATLYDAESRKKRADQQQPARGRGRPPSPNPRDIVSLYLTEAEQTLLTQLTAKFKESMPDAAVSQGQITGFALRLLAEIVEKYGLPASENHTEWTYLVEHLTKNL